METDKILELLLLLDNVLDFECKLPLLKLNNFLADVKVEFPFSNDECLLRSSGLVPRGNELSRLYFVLRRDAADAEINMLLFDDEDCPLEKVGKVASAAASKAEVMEV